MGLQPKVGVILNLTPDHLARHKTMDVYAQMKKRIFAAQSKDDFLLIPFREDDVASQQSKISIPSLMCQ